MGVSLCYTNKSQSVVAAIFVCLNQPKLCYYQVKETRGMEGRKWLLREKVSMNTF